MTLSGLLNQLSNDYGGALFRPIKHLSKCFITWLFAHYYTVEYCIDFYDSDPSDDGIDFDTEKGIKEWRHRVEAYLPTSMQRCTWQDIYREGIWCWTQEQVDNCTKNVMLGLRANPFLTHKHNRVWCGRVADDMILIYYWCRDNVNLRCDYVWVMKER